MEDSLVEDKEYWNEEKELSAYEWDAFHVGTPQRGMRRGLWMPHHVDFLVGLVKKHCPRFDRERELSVWKDIYPEMKEYHPNVTDRQIWAKWHSMKRQVLHYDAGKVINKPPYYEAVKPVACYIKLANKGLNMSGDFSSMSSESMKRKLVEKPPCAKKKNLLLHLASQNQKRVSHSSESPEVNEASHPKNMCEVDHNVTFQELVDEVQRHNAAIETHNTWIRDIFGNIAKSIEERNGILKAVVEKELAADS